MKCSVRQFGSARSGDLSCGHTVTYCCLSIEEMYRQYNRSLVKNEVNYIFEIGSLRLNFVKIVGAHAHFFREVAMVRPQSIETDDIV